MIKQSNRSTGLLSAILTLLVLLAPRPVAAQPPSVYEGFNYAAIDADLDGANGGTGFSGPWSTAVPASHFDIGAGSVSVTGLPTSGNHVTAGPLNSTLGSISRPLGETLGVSGTTRYVSFTIRPEGTLGEGQFNGFFGLRLDGAANLFIGKPGGGALNQFVLENQGGSEQHASGVTAIVGEEYFLVLRANFVNGDDVFTLYVNPVPGAAEPLSGTIKNDVDVGFVTAITLFATGAFSIDEIRLGESYESVVPPLTVPGDVNNNGITDINDYIIIRNNFLGTNKTRAQGDLSGDTVVNFTDFRLWKNNRTAGGAAIDLAALFRDLHHSVPEPAGLALAAAAALAGVATRHRAKTATIRHC